MTPELWYLLWSVVLTFILAVIAVSGATLKVGLPTLAGSRARPARPPQHAGNLILFAILTLTAKAAGVSNATTLLGAHCRLDRVNHRSNFDLLAAAAVGLTTRWPLTWGTAPCGLAT
jgi:hypothetical protein